MPTGCLPNAVPRRLTAGGLATPSPGTARLARSGAWGARSVSRTARGPTASARSTSDRSSTPPKRLSQYSNVCPAATWSRWCGWAERDQRSTFQTTAAASSGVPSWKRTPARR